MLTTKISHLKIGSAPDALYVGTFSEQQSLKTALITCEAKQKNDPLLAEQIIQRVKAAFKLDIENELVVPIGCRVFKNTGLYVVEFEAISKNSAETLDSLIVQQECVYDLVPPLKGING